MKTVLVVFLTACLGFIGCRKLPNGASIDRGEALKVSDAFISSLQAGRIDQAVDMMEPEVLQHEGRDRAEAIARYVFEYCGSPQQVKLWREGTGAFEYYKDGHLKPMREFIYRTTSTVIGEDCALSIQVVPGSDGLRVARLGSLKPT